MTREEAIYRLKALLTMCDYRDAFGDRVDSKLYEDAVAMAVKALQEQKAGKWIFVHPIQEDDSGGFLCSCCRYGEYKQSNYCPHCGASMEVKK